MTAERPENLIYEGQSIAMYSYPDFPRDHARIVCSETPPLPSSGCIRGYIGTWEIKASKFYLKALSGDWELLGPEPLWAEWFSGVLVLPQGEMIGYHSLVYEPLYVENKLIIIEKGCVTEVKVIDNRHLLEAD